MALQLPDSSNVEIPYQDEAKLMRKTSLSSDALFVNAKGWGPVGLHVVQGEKQIPITPTIIGREPWQAAPVSPHSPFQAFFLKYSKLVGKRAAAGSIISLGICPVEKSMEGTSIQKNRFFPFTPMPDANQASALLKSYFSHQVENVMSLALVEMKEPEERVNARLSKMKHDTRDRFAVKRLQQYIELPPNEVEDVLGLFDVKISPEIKLVLS